MLNTFRFDSRGRWGRLGMQGGGRLKEKFVNVQLTVELELHPQSAPLVEPA
jgi:hypothetical protein